MPCISKQCSCIIKCGSLVFLKLRALLGFSELKWSLRKSTATFSHSSSLRNFTILFFLSILSFSAPFFRLPQPLSTSILVQCIWECCLWEGGSSFRHPWKNTVILTSISGFIGICTAQIVWGTWFEVVIMDHCLCVQLTWTIFPRL